MKEYLNAFLYSLALAAGIEVPQAQLSPVAAEVAFKLSEKWSQSALPNDSDEHVPRLSWQIEYEDLPADLKLVCGKLRSGDKLDVKRLLDGIPLWSELKSKAEDNNHRLDSKNNHDKFLKTIQQKILNCLRIQTMLHTVLAQCDNEEVIATSQKFSCTCWSSSRLWSKNASV
jgi:mannosyltransferase OCH1-like enzyme